MQKKVISLAVLAMISGGVYAQVDTLASTALAGSATAIAPDLTQSSTVLTYSPVDNNGNPIGTFSYNTGSSSWTPAAGYTQVAGTNSFTDTTGTKTIAFGSSPTSSLAGLPATLDANGSFVAAVAPSNVFNGANATSNGLVAVSSPGTDGINVAGNPIPFGYVNTVDPTANVTSAFLGLQAPTTATSTAPSSALGAVTVATAPVNQNGGSYTATFSGANLSGTVAGNSVSLSDSSLQFNTLTGTATINPATGDVTATVAADPTQSTTVSATGISTPTLAVSQLATLSGGINSGNININNATSGSNNITNVSILGARQGNFGNTTGTSGVVHVRNGVDNTITLDGESGQVSAISVAASGLVSASEIQVHTNGGTDIAGAAGLEVIAGTGGNGGTAAIGVRNASDTAWNGLTVTDSSASLRGGTASTTLTLNDNGMTVADTVNGNTFTVSNAGDAVVARDASVGRNLSVTGNATVTGDLTASTNAYLGGSGANASLQVTTSSVTVASDTAVSMGGNRVQNVGNGVAATDAVNLRQLHETRTEARRGIAGASAIAGIPALESGKQYNFGVGLGHYKGESALALGGNARFDANTVGRLAVGFSGSDATVSAGVGWSF